MKTAYRIGRVWGIPINLHISLFILMAYMAFAGASEGGWPVFLFVIVVDILIFASIALHELGHSFVAIRKGCRVREITLMFIGGAAQMEQIPRRPRDELLMAIAGPSVSLLLGALLMGLTLLIPAQKGAFSQWIVFILRFVGVANIVLACFNLLPAFPMDGGRVFRAMLTPKMGRLRATRLATATGKGVAVLFILAGLFGLPWPPMLNDGSIGLIFIAGFIFIIGGREYQMVQVEELMRNRGFQTGSAPPPPVDDIPSPDDDAVLISPPPYEKGPVQKVEIQKDRPRNPLRDLFG